MTVEELSIGDPVFIYLGKSAAKMNIQPLRVQVSVFVDVVIRYNKYRNKIIKLIWYFMAILYPHFIIGFWLSEQNVVWLLITIMWFILSIYICSDYNCNRLWFICLQCVIADIRCVKCLRMTNVRFFILFIMHCLSIP